MLFKNAISKAKKLFHKIYKITSLQSFKDLLSGGYEKLPKPTSVNPIYCTGSRFNKSSRELDLIYSQWECDQHEEKERMIKKKESMRENQPIKEDFSPGSFMKFGMPTTPLQLQTGNSDKRKKTANEEEEEEEEGCPSHADRVRFEQKLRELVLIDITNVEHVLDIEEVLHYYSRLTCPFYVDIVNRFFVEMYSEILSQYTGVKNPQFAS